ncbi:MAG: SIR2 family protein [Rhodospirillales bacterium]|nr:SIR2 family protein [Rhodospirillales bacterium]
MQDQAASAFVASAVGGGDTNLPYQGIAKALQRGNVVPFLGAGASVFHRPRERANDVHFCPPTGAALADHLAKLAHFPDSADAEHRRNLPLVASYAGLVTLGAGFLREELREVFSPEFEPNALHTLLARIAHTTNLLIVTTNYDDMLERAFEREGVPYHLVATSMGDIEKAGSLLHREPNGKSFAMVQPKKLDVTLEQASIIYKMHGSINRLRIEDDSYVITEEDYVRFLGGFSAKQLALVPPMLAAMMKTRHFLFLGYSLRDWNLRVLLDMLSQFDNNAAKRRSWAIQHNPDTVEERIWERKAVDVYGLDLQMFVGDLGQAFEAVIAPS